MKARTAHSLLVATLLLSLLAVSIEAYPSGRSHRQKRVSDQRLAELQTMLAILKLKGNLKNPSGKYNGFVDPALIGRKKRSQMMYEYTEPQDLQTQRDILDDTDDVDYYDTDRAETKDQRQSEAEARRYLRRRLSTYH